MTASNRVTRTTSAAAVLAALLAGCAVLKIDVDVYKGALQNQPDVQTQQVVTLASAAKPLLVRLRYELEESERKIQFAEWDKAAAADQRAQAEKAEKARGILSPPTLALEGDDQP